MPDNESSLATVPTESKFPTCADPLATILSGLILIKADASGLGGQRLLIIPEFNIIAVFTGWNVYETTALSSYLALQKVLGSVQK